MENFWAWASDKRVSSARRAVWEKARLVLAVAIWVGVANSFALAQEEHGASTGDLAKAAQNPIADMISVPLQSNFNFHAGPHDQLQYVLNVQPVVPIALSQESNLITRWITPVISQPPMTVNGDRESGLGDNNPSFFFSPKQPTHGIIWGIGPTVVFPTGTDKTLTAGKYSLGPTFVALTDRRSLGAGSSSTTSGPSRARATATPSTP
jgi:hypothetical protein